MARVSYLKSPCCQKQAVLQAEVKEIIKTLIFFSATPYCFKPIYLNPGQNSGLTNILYSFPVPDKATADTTISNAGTCTLRSVSQLQTD